MPKLNSGAASGASRADKKNEDPLDALLVYDGNGYLPIHRAAFHGHEATIRNILDDALQRADLQQQLEARTEKNELTPLLLAVAVGRLEIIACLLKYRVDVNAVDANGNGIAAIAALSQNERTLRYIIDLHFPNDSYNVWKPLFKLFASLSDDESIVCGRALELLTRREPNSHRHCPYWPTMVENGLVPTLIHVFTESKNDDVLVSAYLLLLNCAVEYPTVKDELIPVKTAFSSMLKHTRSANSQIVTLLGRVLACLSENKSLIVPMVDQGLIEALMILVNKERSPQIIASYFDCLANIVSYSPEYQLKLANSQEFLSLLINHYLEEFDLRLSLSAVRFIRELVLKNEQIQNLLAKTGACEHLLSALSASSKDLQQVAIEAIQALSDKNVLVQRLMLRENALEQLLSLLEKTNLSSLQIAIVCTLWTLCGNSSLRKREVATRIGVKKLIGFFSIKSDEHLLAITDALGELAKRTASIKMNIQEEINHAQGIPYLIRLLKSDNETLVLSVLKTLQLLACAPGYVSNRRNQETIAKYDGVTIMIALMFHAKSEIVQVEAAQALACVGLINPRCASIIENTLEFSYDHLFSLRESKNPMVQLKATNALATFVYNNPRVQLHIGQHHQLPFDYFQSFLQSNDDHMRCAAAFQLVVLSGLIRERTQSDNTAIGCGILIDILRNTQTEGAKPEAAECIARLAHLKSGVPQALISVNAIDYLCDLFSSSHDTTIGIASVALGFLSNVPEGQRKLLHRCRGEPDIMAFLKVYNCLPDKQPRISKHLLEDWNRYNVLKLPKLRSRGSNIRYFKVLSNNIERLRAAPPSTLDVQPTTSTAIKFYLPPIRQKIK
ncbi:unnamed protein product [Rotaria magnacalcarata]|uniref:Ankyrin and armadillo repeat-containing protein n=1 Tax=Rotaria magnacalcarata TaxID=392030 RepID=A0A818X3G7_9BILA|nr:unnamed protein product [Rotaria magnacalcarata]CAF3732078.1 unnamed protein product [Rotaria magnacalcarata]